MTDLDILLEIKTELNRFNRKFREAITEQKEQGDWGSKRKLTSARRAALDLKNELTKLTQSSKYKWK